MDHPNSYASLNLNKAEKNYSMTWQEGPGMIFDLETFHHYLFANPFIFYIDNKVLKYMVTKPLHRGRIWWWLLLFQEFEFEVIVQVGHENVVPGHFSRV